MPHRHTSHLHIPPDTHTLTPLHTPSKDPQFSPSNTGAPSCWQWDSAGLAGRPLGSQGPLSSRPLTAAGVPLPRCLFGSFHLQSQVQAPFRSSSAFPWETLGQEPGHSGAPLTRQSCLWAPDVCLSRGLCLKWSICVNKHPLVPHPHPSAPHPMWSRCRQWFFPGT